MSFERGSFGGAGGGTFASSGTFAFGGNINPDTVQDEIPFRRRSGSSAPIALAEGKIPFLNVNDSEDPFNLNNEKAPFLDSTGSHLDIALV